MIDRIDNGECDLPEEGYIRLLKDMSVLTSGHVRISKYQMLRILGVSRSVFDGMVSDGRFGKHRSQQGFKENFWTVDDVVQYCDGLDEKRSKEILDRMYNVLRLM